MQQDKKQIKKMILGEYYYTEAHGKYYVDLTPLLKEKLGDEFYRMDDFGINEACPEYIDWYIDDTRIRGSMQILAAPADIYEFMKRENELLILESIIYRASGVEPFDESFDNVSENAKFLIRQLDKAMYIDKYSLIDISNVSRHAIKLNNVWFDIKMPVSIKITTPCGWQMIEDGDMNCIADTFLKSRENDKKIEYLISDNSDS